MTRELYDDAQRRRWMRADAHLYVRPDAWRWAKPGAPGDERPDWAAGYRPPAWFKAARERDAACRSKANFNPDQPRDEQGRWTDAGGGINDRRVISDVSLDDSAIPGTQYAQNRSSFPVDLHEERTLGGHTIEEHVGKSPDSLLSNLQQQIASARRKGDSFDNLRVGSFPSIEAATKLVNSTLSRNRNKVDLVANGTLGGARFDAYFESPTGYEAYARTERSEAHLRTTYGVRVVIVNDQRVAKGYRVHTAFPHNIDR